MLYIICKYFFQFVYCLFTLLVGFDAQTCLGFIEIQFIYFSFFCLCFLCHIQEIIAKSNKMKLFYGSTLISMMMLWLRPSHRFRYSGVNQVQFEDANPVEELNLPKPVGKLLV